MKILDADLVGLFNYRYKTKPTLTHVHVGLDSRNPAPQNGFDPRYSDMTKNQEGWIVKIARIKGS